MAIGVYRIFVSCLWTGDAFDRLVATLDSLPAFLYRIDRVPEEDLAAAAGSDEALRSALRIAMTQSHIALTRIDGTHEATPLAQIERDLARTAFRRRIPLVGVDENALEVAPQGVAAAHEIDRLIPLDAAMLAAAIQDLAEQAAAERRRANDALVSMSGRPVAAGPRMFEPAVPSAHLATDASDPATASRALPVAEIIEAFARLRATRQGDKPQA